MGCFWIVPLLHSVSDMCRGADKSLVRPGRKQTTATEDFDFHIGKDKGHPAPGQAQGIPGRLRPRIFLTFGTTRVVGLQPYAPTTFTPREIPGTHFQRLSRPQGTWFCRSHGKNHQRHHRESIPGPSD